MPSIRLVLSYTKYFTLVKALFESECLISVTRMSRFHVNYQQHSIHILSL